ncbi:thioredoxin family protein [Luteolibacter flavescens]|uniref:Thioredoxin family protein n=1 Tax=Luteolibacter flavescens TaxID=1859460 RepID=A0ABT3FN23_9BACT|nr:thioredoxin family protein [Luteolibacter flavescens]MCW1884857.1 thioredoxin family protein [Luteolibacter flavescens]
MNTRHILAAACAATFAVTSAFAGGEGWTHDFAAAKKQADSEKKDLLMDFTGSDWCGWCIKLNDEVFKHDAFKTGVKDKFVLVELDYPEDKSKLSEETQKQNEELQGKYGIQGFPTILLCDAEGKPFAKTGYQAGGPEKYVAHLDELRAKKETRDKAFADAGKAEGTAKAKALVAALDAMELEDETVGAFYGDVVEQIKTADPKDETGYAKKLAMKQKFAEFGKKLNESKNHDEALAFVEKSEGEFEGEQKQQIVGIKAQIYAMTGKFDEAIKTADEAKAIAPDSAMVGQLENFKKNVEAAKAKAAAAPKEEGKEDAGE